MKPSLAATYYTRAPQRQGTSKGKTGANAGAIGT